MDLMSTGDYVLINPNYTDRPEHRGKVWTITAVHAVNIDIEPVNGGKGVRIHPMGLIRATPEQVEAAKAQPKLEILRPGAIVTVNGPGWKQPPAQLYVVMAETAKGVKLANFGGSTRYWPNVPRSYVTAVDAEAVTAAINAIQLVGHRQKMAA